MSTSTTDSFVSLLCMDDAPAGLFTNVQEAWSTLVRETSNIQVLNLGEFLCTIIPFTLHDAQLPTVSDIVRALEKNGALVPVDTPHALSEGDNLRWKEFNRVSEDSKDVHEIDLSQSIAVVVGKIKDAVEAHNGPAATMAYTNEPKMFLKSRRRTNLTRPDGYFCFDGDSEPCKVQVREWYNIGVVGEYKKTRSLEDIHDNLHKMLWDMNNVMREDPSRRYTLGFTVEDCMMTLWYCDRSQVIASTAFDFIRTPSLLVDFFMRIMYAPRSALGCDPTMELVESTCGGPPLYKMTIFDIDTITGEPSPHYYITEKMINNAPTGGIVARGTRVWSAREINGARRRCVIKDYWIDHDRDAEGDVMASIKNAFPPENPHHSTLNKHLLTVLSQGKVPRDVQSPLIPDTTLDVLASCRLDFKAYWVLHLGAAMRAVGTSDPDAYTPVLQSSLVDRFDCNALNHGRRLHYRIAFAEEGESLYAVKSLATVFPVLTDVADCLTALHAAGWVHRDVSPGNIIVLQDEDGPRGVLADFEYAAYHDDPRVVDKPERIGTFPFMPIEVNAGKSLFTKPPPETPNFDTPLDPEVEFTIGKCEALYSTPRTKPLFRYHPLNDWESVFWIGTYFLVALEVKQASMADRSSTFKPQPEEDRAHQIHWARLLCNDQATCRDIFTSEDQTQYMEGNQYVHAALRVIALGHLERMRRALVNAYKSVESGPTPPTFEESVGSGVASVFKTSMDRIKKYLKNVDITVGDFGFHPPTFELELSGMSDEGEPADLVVAHMEDVPTLDV